MLCKGILYPKVFGMNQTKNQSLGKLWILKKLGITYSAKPFHVEVKYWDY